jgi:hypothetical protein
MSHERFLELCEELANIMQIGTYEEARQFLFVHYQEFPVGIEGETMKVFFESVLKTFENEDDLQLARERLVAAISVMKNPSN